MRVKSSRIALELANARPPGGAKFANAPLPGLTRRANTLQYPGGGGWALLELTDVLFLPIKRKRVWKMTFFNPSCLENWAAHQEFPGVPLGNSAGVSQCLYLSEGCYY